jgi:argininosuccinate lyase
MLNAASDPQMAATDLADRLVQEGVPFREAHTRVGAMIRSQAGSNGIILDSVPSPEKMVEARKHRGGTGRAGVIAQIREAKAFLKKNAEKRTPETSHSG